MKLLELAEKIVDPWDLAFAITGYAAGFAVGAVLAPGGLPAGELAALCAASSVSVKQILWRVTARRRIRGRGRRFRVLLTRGGDGAPLLTRLDRELALLDSAVVSGDQATKALDALVEEFRATKESLPPEPALPAGAATVALPTVGDTLRLPREEPPRLLGDLRRDEAEHAK
jgi:hypothetical protein